ncbi:hypothetical protein F4808DRAFT_410653 [Astrocystis sublimbata]|nr:hypothetical protein F4808DRAFT_410653 [Astrocystis sublimbata]
MNVAKHPLRRSCGFCRARKIKCSNETICEACRKQNVDCVYDFEPHQPAPKPKSRPSHGQSDAGHSASHSDVTTPGSSNPAEEGEQMSTPLEPSDLASELENVFHDVFSTYGQDAGPNIWHQKISSFCQSIGLPPSESSDKENVGSCGQFQLKSNAQVLSLIVKDIVALIVTKFGSLGCHLIEGGGGRFLVDGLQSDRTDSMFDPLPPGSDLLASSPVSGDGIRKVSQLIDIWFSNHPLSFLLSKTLVMHELQRETLDEMLLAAILVDVHSFVGGDAATARGRALRQWTAEKLRGQPYYASDDSPSPSSSNSPRPSSARPTISTIQTLTLLGWHALSQAQIRRAVCYIGVACRLTTQLKNGRYSGTSSALNTSRINGIDVCDIEKELIAYLWWTNFAIFQWLFLQMDQQLPYLPVTNLTTDFLPIDASSSALVRLDEASDNISTLRTQKIAHLHMWPLTHVCSLVAYIYDLYPEDAQLAEAAQPLFWQEAPLFALGRIQTKSAAQSLDIICQKIYPVLMDSVSIMERKIDQESSRTFILVVYQILGIHTIFPRSSAAYGGATPNSRLPTDMIVRFCNSAEELIKIISSAHESLDVEPLSTIPFQLHPASPEMFTLALDTCSRAISRIYAEIARCDDTTMDTQVNIILRNRLDAILARLLDLASVRFFSPSPSFRAVREYTESVARNFRATRGTQHQFPKAPDCSISRNSAPSAQEYAVILNHELASVGSSPTAALPSAASTVPPLQSHLNLWTENSDEICSMTASNNSKIRENFLYEFDMGNVDLGTDIRIDHNDMWDFRDDQMMMDLGFVDTNQR